MNLISRLLIAFALFSPVYAISSNHGLDGFIEGEIDAAKNARMHSNMGNIFFDEKKYVSALKEYEIAFNLSHNTQASGVYLYNIAKCLIVLGDYKAAKKAVEGAIKKDCINITYYEMLADCIIKLNEQDEEIKKLIKDTKNPYNRVIVGLIYLKTGKNIQAKITFDDFVQEFPDMIISQDINFLLKNIKF